MMSSESESTAANSNNDEQQQIKMTRMAEWRKKADAVCFDVDSTVIGILRSEKHLLPARQQLDD